MAWFEPDFARQIRRRRTVQIRSYVQWRSRLDEGVVKISSELHYLWRAADHEVLESFVTKTRDKLMALTFLKKAIGRSRAPNVLFTDGLRSYGAAMREIGNLERREVGRHINNREENSDLPFRRWARAMLRFRRMSSLQRFCSTHASIQNHFNARRHLNPRPTVQRVRVEAQSE